LTTICTKDSRMPLTCYELTNWYKADPQGAYLRRRRSSSGVRRRI